MDEHGNPDAIDTASDEELLDAFIGPNNAHYFAGAFNAFARGENVKWNWPAFFVTFPWMLHRKMWTYALGYIIGLHVIMQLLFMYGRVSYSSQFLLSLIVYFVVTPLFATRLYYAHARSKIGNIKLQTSSAEEQRTEVARVGGTSIAGVVVGVLLLVVPAVGGIIAAISIPAYNDYTVRAQVTEGLNLSAGAKAAVTEYYQDMGAFPPDNASAGLSPATDIRGKYVSSVQVNGGEITVTYGNDSDGELYGATLVVHPQPQAGSVDWSCYSQDIQPKNLPAACRR